MKGFPVFVVLFVSTLLMHHSVDAWGKEGHEIVASIAQNSLSQDTWNAIQGFLNGAALADIAPLPDDYDHSSQGRWSSPCHFVNLPRGSTSFQWGDCPLFCVVEAINNYTQLFSAQKSNPTPCNYDQEDGVEPCPLEFLVHFLGDVHQPLHISYADDEGGNKVQASFFGEETNLHTVWDTKIITKWQPFHDMSQAVSDLETMMSNNPDTVKQILQATDPIAWANESLAFTLANVYNFTTDDNGVAQIGEDYYDINLPVIQWRLISAGVRLGQLITTAMSSPVEYNKVPIVDTLPPVSRSGHRKRFSANKTF